jgi:NADH dehydrogenase
MNVAIFGGGYAGVTLARRLERRLPDAVDLVLVDETGTHVVRHELHRLLRRPSLGDDLEIPLHDLLDRTSIREARVTAVDPDRNVAALADGDTLEYDVGAVCLGAETTYFGMDDVAEHAAAMWTLEDALAVREAFLEVLDRDGTFVVGGAGLTGIQVAGELAALAEAEAKAEAETETVDDRRPRIVLLEQQSAVAPGFRDDFQAAVRSALEEYGVDVRTEATVTGATADRIEVAESDPIDYDGFVWTGGISGPGALGGQRRPVRSTLRLDGDTFVLGDAAQVVDAEGRAVPASAQAAIREAEAVAGNVERLVDHADDPPGSFAPRLEPFTFEPAGWMVSVGDEAVAQVGPTVLTGPAAKTIKATVGAGYRSSIGSLREAADRLSDEFQREARS